MDLAAPPLHPRPAYLIQRGWSDGLVFFSSDIRPSTVRGCPSTLPSRSPLGRPSRLKGAGRALPFVRGPPQYGGGHPTPSFRSHTDLHSRKICVARAGTSQGASNPPS